MAALFLNVFEEVVISKKYCRLWHCR